MGSAIFTRLRLAALLSLALLPRAHATDAGTVVLKDSVVSVDAAPPSTTASGTAKTHKAFITRRTLKATEESEMLEFEVALKVPGLADLQARVTRHDHIAAKEMAKYQPSADAYARVVAWLKSQGLAITYADPSHVAVFAQGTVSQVQAALGVSFARVSADGVEYTSAITAPSVPAGLSPLLVGINGLQPHLQARKHLVFRPASLTNTNPPYLPSQIAQAYNANGLYSANVTGTGQTIAIVIDTFPNSSDLTSFWSTYSVSQSINNITFIQVVRGTLPSPSGEETLDTEWSSSIAPGANVRIYATRTLSFTHIDEAYARIYSDVTNNPSLNINQMSMSYGLGETYESSSQLQTDDQYFALLAGAGVSLFASSGDAGATPDSTGHAGGGPLQVESPASDPNVTGVGGTSLTLTGSGSESTEVVWNNSPGASGGGISQVFSRPSWQTGAGVPSGTMRLVPDVSASADPDNGAVLILNGSQTVVGGTSWSSPTWAGFNALINQVRANASLAPIGPLAPNLYQFIGTSIFRDITSGNNDFQSTQGYSAGTGYDLCTGIGVPNVQALASALAPSTNSAPSFTDGPATATGQVGAAYSFTYTASGSPAPTFSLQSGSQLPPGITLASTGTLSGTPTQSGIYTGTVVATNGISPNATQAYSLTIDQAPAFTDGPPPSTTINTAYSFAYSASGYPAPTFSASPGSLPPGLTLSSAGALTGTATLAGSYTGTVTATNGISPDATQLFTLEVDQAPAFTNAPLSTDTTTGSTLAFMFQASGYPAPTFSVTAGSLPPGVMLSPSGMITGSPTQAGTFTGTITATNGVGTDATQGFTVIVEIPADTPVLPPWGLPCLAVVLLAAGAFARPSRIARAG